MSEVGDDWGVVSPQPPKRKIWFLPPDQWSPRAELLWWGVPLVVLLLPLWVFVSHAGLLEIIGWTLYYTAWYVGWGWAFYGVRKRRINKDKEWLNNFMEEQERRRNNGS